MRELIGLIKFVDPKKNTRKRGGFLEGCGEVREVPAISRRSRGSWKVLGNMGSCLRAGAGTSGESAGGAAVEGEPLTTMASVSACALRVQSAKVARPDAGAQSVRDKCNLHGDSKKEHQRSAGDGECLCFACSGVAVTALLSLVVVKASLPTRHFIWRLPSYSRARRGESGQLARRVGSAGFDRGLGRGLRGWLASRQEAAGTWIWAPWVET